MGAIRDATGSFDIPFIIAGISFIVSALMHFYLMWRMQKEKKQANDIQKVGVDVWTRMRLPHTYNFPILIFGAVMRRFSVLFLFSSIHSWSLVFVLP